MSFFTSFFGKLGHVFTSPSTAQGAQVAGAVLAPFAPGIGALVETIAGAVYSIETRAAAGTSGADKKSQAQSILDVAAPVATTVLNQIAGKQIDPSSVGPVLDKLIDDVVALFHVLGVFSHSTSPAAVPTPAAVATATPVDEPFIPAGVPSFHPSN